MCREYRPQHTAVCPASPATSMPTSPNLFPLARHAWHLLDLLKNVQTRARAHTRIHQYDLIELRAVTACLPERFEVDSDGRKAAWRAGFLQRVQGMVAQVSSMKRNTWSDMIS